MSLKFLPNKIEKLEDKKRFLKNFSNYLKQFVPSLIYS